MLFYLFRMIQSTGGLSKIYILIIISIFKSEQLHIVMIILDNDNSAIVRLDTWTPILAILA